jgi:Mycolic acid cyclopropane synthetase
MSVFVKSSTSLLMQSMPSNYNDVRTHHVLALYVAMVGATSIMGLSQEKISKFVLSMVAKFTRAVISPYIYKGAMPDWITRRVLRIQLQDELLQSIPEDAESTIDAKMIVLHQLKGYQTGVANGIGPVVENDNDDDDDEDDDEINVVATKSSSIDADLPTALYGMCLGPAKKFSAGFWPNMSSTTLEESEVNMMHLCCVRAGVEDGMRIVDLQCGSGALSLYIAENFPSAHVTAICLKDAQRRLIMKVATAKNLSNIHVITVRSISFASVYFVHVALCCCFLLFHLPSKYKIIVVTVRCIR